MANTSEFRAELNSTHLRKPEPVVQDSLNQQRRGLNYFNARETINRWVNEKLYVINNGRYKYGSN
jgi:hypothetical protein